MNCTVFITHSHKDLPLARQVARELGLRGICCRTASTVKAPDAGPLQEIARDLKQATAGVVIATRAAESSVQVLREVEWLIIHDRPVLVVKPDEFELGGTLGDLLRAAPSFSMAKKPAGICWESLVSELQPSWRQTPQATWTRFASLLKSGCSTSSSRWQRALFASAIFLLFASYRYREVLFTNEAQQLKAISKLEESSEQEISPVSNQESLVKVSSLPLDLPRELSNSIGMKFVLIPPGSFTRHSPSRPMESATVTLTKPYFLGITEVNQMQFEELMGKPASFFLGDLLPVDQATWKDAVEFCRRLSELSEEKAAGRSYRLPTEAEWEFASRAGSGKFHFFGDNIKDADRFVWFDANSDRETHAVGIKLPNAWGLYDIYGNSPEWCSDWAADYPVGGQTDPQGPETGSQKVIRGGGMADRILLTSSNNRKWGFPEASHSGFRIVCEVMPPKFDGSGPK